MATGLLAKGTPVQPKWIIVMRIIILVLSVIVMGLTAWAIYLYTNPLAVASSSYSGYSGSSSCTTSSYYCKARRSLEARYYSYSYYTPVMAAPGLLIFSTIMSLATYASVIAVERTMPTQVYRLGVFLAYIFTAIFLLSGWSYMASLAGPIVSVLSLYSSYSTDGLNGYLVQVAASTAASAALGAVLWVLVLITTIMYAVHSSRSPGTQVNYGAPAGAATPMQAMHKQEPNVTVMPVPGPHPSAYQGYGQQQPYPQQQPQAYVHGAPQYHQHVGTQ